MKTYDKASWHIDGGENASEVITRFKEIFVFLAEKEMLNTIGEETQEFGMDDSVSLNSTMVNDDGKAFLDTYYDIVLNQNPYEITDNLQTAYENYLDKKNDICMRGNLLLTI